MSGRYWIETLGCPKNEVDSAKLAGTLVADGYVPAGSVADADLVVVNTCAFIEPARLESIETILALHDERSPDSRLVVTGCMAERYGEELAGELPEVDLVAGFGVPVQLGPARLGGRKAPSGGFDLLELPRPPSAAPWAYVKVAEGCDRMCGFCAIPSFRGKQRSRSIASILSEVDALGAREIVLVAQDLASWGRDQATPRGAAAGGGPAPIVGLIRAIAERVDRVRALYLYPSALTPPLVDAIIDTGVPYFDLSLQHASGRLLRKMRRFGDGGRFLGRIDELRAKAPDAALRSSFIVGYPGETEEDHDELLSFIEEAQLDWAGFFTYSEEAGTYAAGLDGKVPPALVEERMRECGELQDRITASRRSALIGSEIEVLVDAVGSARSHREAPVIDGVVKVPSAMEIGALTNVLVTGACGPDLEAVPVTVTAGR
jgi:ribosomal protein S12 methylthiotransferase